MEIVQIQLEIFTVHDPILQGNNKAWLVICLCFVFAFAENSEEEVKIKLRHRKWLNEKKSNTNESLQEVFFYIIIYYFIIFAKFPWFLRIKQYLQVVKILQLQ